MVQNKTPLSIPYCTFLHLHLPEFCDIIHLMQPSTHFPLSIAQNFQRKITIIGELTKECDSKSTIYSKNQEGL